MAFDSIAGFLQMGNHGVYVWSSYAVSLVALVGLLVNTRLSRKQLKKQLKKRYHREQSR